MDLRCRKTNCEFNKNLTCTAQKINISSELICKSYKKGDDKELKDFSSKIFTDNPPKIENYRHIKDSNLVCNANCLFNRDGKCISNGITVNSSLSNKPECITYMIK